MSKKEKFVIRVVSVLLLAVYLSVLLYFLFFSERYGRGDISAHGNRFNLIPFAEIRRFWQNRESLGMSAVTVNILGNVLAFIPLGFLMPAIFARFRKGPGAVALGFFLSLLVEGMQLLTGVGSFDVDDLILNTLGTAAGYLMFRLCLSIRRRQYGKKI